MEPRKPQAKHSYSARQLTTPATASQQVSQSRVRVIASHKPLIKAESAPLLRGDQKQLKGWNIYPTSEAALFSTKGFRKTLEMCRQHTRNCAPDVAKYRKEVCDQIEKACQNFEDAQGKTPTAHTNLEAASTFYRKLHIISLRVKDLRHTDLRSLCHKTERILHTLMLHSLQIPPTVESEAVFSQKYGGKLELDENFASGLMSTLMHLKGSSTDFVAKVLSPASIATDPMKFSGIPEQNPGLGLRSLASYKTACLFGQKNLIPRTRIIIVDGLVCLAQGFVSGEEAIHSKCIRHDDSDYYRLADEIKKKEVDKGQHFDTNELGKRYMEVYDSLCPTDYDKLAKQLLDGVLTNNIHISISPFYRDKFFKHFMAHNEKKLAKMFRKQRIHLKNHQEFLQGLAFNQILYRIHKIATPNLDIDFSTPLMQKRMSWLHCLDLLTGQVDRHTGNIRYQPVYEGGVRVGYEPVGIDNDLSFGQHFTDISEAGLVRMSVQGPKHPPILFDQEVVDNILRKEWPEWEEELQACGLGESEIQAAKCRYQQISSAIRCTDSVRVVSHWNDTTYRQQISTSPVNSYTAHHALARCAAAQSAQQFEQLLHKSLKGNGALVRDCLYEKGGIYNLGPDIQKLLTTDALLAKPVIMHEALVYPEYSKVLELYAKNADDATFTQLMTADCQGQKKILTMAIQIPSPDIPDELYTRLVTCTPGLLVKLLSEGVQMNNDLAVEILDQLADKEQKTSEEQILINKAHAAINRHFDWFGDGKVYSQPE